MANLCLQRKSENLEADRKNKTDSLHELSDRLMDVLSEKTEDGAAEVMWLSCVTKQTNSSPATGGSPSSRMEPALLWISSSFIGGSRLLTKALLPIGRMSLKVHNPPTRESKIETPLALRWNYLLDNDPRAWLQTDRAQIGKKLKNITKKEEKVGVGTKCAQETFFGGVIPDWSDVNDY